MSTLFNDISKIVSQNETTQVQESSSFLIENWESRAQIERVHLFEAKRILNNPKPSISEIAQSMVEISGTHSTTNVERNPEEAIITSAKLFRTSDHLRESWQTMGKLIESAHTNHNVNLREMLGSYNETQVNLLEMTLDLPWRLNYSEPVDVEVHDYAVPGQEHVFKGTEPEDTTYGEAEDEVEGDETEVATESKLRKLKKSLYESKGKSSGHSKEQLVKEISTMLGSGTYQMLSRNRAKGTIEVRKFLPGREYQDFVITIKEK